MIIAIDFDGTCVTHEFPNVGKEVGAAPVLRELVAAGHQLILWTIRDDKREGDDVLAPAVKWFAHHGIPLYGINSNPTQHAWSLSPKVYAQLFIDDAALGCPLLPSPDMDGRPFVNWVEVRRLLVEMGALAEVAIVS